MPGIAGKSCSAQVGVTVILPWTSGRITNYLFKLTTKTSIFVANMPSNSIMVEQVAKVTSNEHGSRMTSSRGMRQSIIIDFCINSIHRPYQLFSRCTQRLGHHATPWDDVRCYFFLFNFATQLVFQRTYRSRVLPILVHLLFCAENQRLKHHLLMYISS